MQKVFATFTFPSAEGPHATFALQHPFDGKHRQRTARFYQANDEQCGYLKKGN